MYKNYSAGMVFEVVYISEIKLLEQDYKRKAYV